MMFNAIRRNMANFWKMLHQVKMAALRGPANVSEPFSGHSIAEQHLIVGMFFEQQGFSGFYRYLLRGPGNNFFDRFPDFDKLGSTGARMGFNPPTLGLGIGVVVVIDISDQDTVGRAMNDQPDIAVDPDRPEVRVLGSVEFVKLQPG